MTALRTTVIGSYPFPGWLEHAAANLGDFGPDDVAELQEDAVIAAVHDQVAAGLDAIRGGATNSDGSIDRPARANSSTSAT